MNAPEIVQFTKKVEAERYARERRAAGDSSRVRNHYHADFTTSYEVVTIVGAGRKPKAPEAPAETTCQICGRAIKLLNGRIAHHGYRRPGGGWQTPSCMGAGYRPYEVAHDGLDTAIKLVAIKAERDRRAAKELTEAPPATLEKNRLDAYGRISRTDRATRPDGFSPEADRDYRPGSYSTLFHERLSGLLGAIRNWDSELIYLNRRRQEWRAPESK